MEMRSQFASEPGLDRDHHADRVGDLEDTEIDWYGRDESPLSPQISRSPFSGYACVRTKRRDLGLQVRDPRVLDLPPTPDVARPGRGAR